MGENSLKVLSFLAIIIGASGLGFGTYSLMQVQSGAVKGDEGDDGDDGSDGITTYRYVNFSKYLCSSELEIINALNDIGMESGIITIIDNITLSNKININGGGSYIIQGQGASTIIDCGFDRTAFEITDAESCTIQNLKIDALDLFSILTKIIYIDESSDNPIYIENVEIIGDTLNGIGISINSNNVWIRDCYISGVYRGISQLSGNIKAHINGNTLYDCNYVGIEVWGTYNEICGNIVDYGPDFAISCHESWNTISNNIISNCQTGIHVQGDDNTIGNNILNTINTGAGIYINGDQNTISGNQVSNADYGGVYLLTSSYCVVSGNTITDINDFASFNITGIGLDSNCDYNTISGNGCFCCRNTGSGDGYGFFISDYTCDDNTLVGNTTYDNDIPILNKGTYTSISGNNFN